MANLSKLPAEVVENLRILLADLAATARNTLEVKRFNQEPARFEKVTTPTPVQQRALDPLGVKLVVQTATVMVNISCLNYIAMLGSLIEGTSA